MALKDVKEYFLKMQDTYLACKENEQEMLKEYKEGNITQEQADNYQKYVANLKINYDRLAYVMYLFKLPNRKNKQDKFNKSNYKLIEYFDKTKSTQNDVDLENEDILKTLQHILKENK